MPGTKRKRRIRPTQLPYKKFKKQAGPATTGAISRRYIAPYGLRHAVLRYSARFQLNPASVGVPDTKQYSANNLFDPDIQLGGHQPRGYDQYMAMYEHAWVKSATIKCYFDNNAEASALWVGVHVRDSTSPMTNYFDIMEYGLKSGTVLGSSAGGDARTATLKVDVGKFLGIKDLTDALELRNSKTSGAIDPVVFHVSAFPLNDGDSAPINCLVEIEYDVVFCQPQMPGGS